MEQVITDGQTCKARIIEEISKAKYAIKIAMAFFTDREIANELILSKKKGVDISVILSNDSNNENIIKILSGEIDVTIFKSNGRGIMHHKFCIIDNSILIHGSFNYTYNAINNNQESLVVTDSYNLIKEHSSIFENLLKEAKEADFFNNNYYSFPKEQPEEDNYLESFREQLDNHISQMFDNFEENEIVEEGRKISESNNGQENVFIAYLDSVLARANNKLNQDDQTKTIVKTRMTASLDRAIENNSRNLESEIKIIEDHNNQKKSFILEKIESLTIKKVEKRDEINQINSELSAINNSITEIDDEIDDICIQSGVRNFKKPANYLKIAITLIFFVYLSIFFGSAIWKIFFEQAMIEKISLKGLTPEKPPLFDADALYKIFSKKGFFYGMVGLLFFMIPVLLTSIKLISDNKIVEVVFGWIIGIFAIDIVISILISQHMLLITNSLNGTSLEWSLSDAVTTGEFWLIFIFGALPLFLTKVLIENIANAYKMSDPELVDRDKSLKIRSLKRKLAEKRDAIAQSNLKLDILNSDLLDLNQNILKFEDEINEINNYLNNKKLELNERNGRRNKNLGDIYNTFIASVDSGNKQFLQNVISGRVTAFKKGYYNFLISYYAESQANKRIENLELAHKHWIDKNF